MSSLTTPIDIRPDHLRIVRGILRAHVPVEVRAWVFGSRADWTTKDSSDLDLALKANAGSIAGSSARSKMPSQSPIFPTRSMSSTSAEPSGELLVSTETLTSLAMLKVHVDRGEDYLYYLQPFILQVLVVHKPDLITDAIVRDHIRTDFGLEIPDRAVQVVLKRLSRQFPLKKDHGIYRIDGELPDPRIAAKKAEASRHIQAVLSGLREFSMGTAKPIASSDEAVTAICAFLTQFNIPCLRAYLRGTAIPTIEGRHHAEIVLVSQYVLALQNTDPERFESFHVVVKGHMLANALLCPDLQDAPKSYRGVTFYLDTPLLVRRLGLEGEPKQAAVNSLVALLRSLGATVAAFSHSRDELESVITGAARHVDSWEGRGAIVTEARQRGTTKSDLLVLAGQIDDKLEDARIDVLGTPRYIEDFQIDEMVFENVLGDEVSYFNPRAKEHDVNSVRSIYVLRKGTSEAILERAKAALVTSNTGFSRAAFQYGKRHAESREVSSVITDFSLANMAWLKAPLGAPSIPMTELLAFSYAALEPSKELLEKYLSEIDKLANRGKITARDHQLLRSSQLVTEELMNLTLGEEDALTEQTITETLKRVTDEIRREESDNYRKERAAHQETLKALRAQRTVGERVQERLYWHCRRRATLWAWCVSISIGVFLAVGVVAGMGLRANNVIIGGLLLAASGVSIALTLGNLIFGTNVRRLHERVQTRCLSWLISRKTADTGLDLSSRND